MSMQIVPLNEEHLEQAAEMVAARYRAARARGPIIPARFEGADAILPRLADMAGNVPGVAAMDDGRLAGFTFALLVMNRGERLAYVPDIGHAARSEGEYDICRRMYAHLADRWLAHGCFLHGITFFPHERQAVDAWVSVGFGLAVIDALRTLNPIPRSAARVEICRLGPGDVDRVTPLWLSLERHLSSSPIYLPLLIQDGRQGLVGWLSDERHALWLACQDGAAVGYLRFEPSEGLVLPTASSTTVAITGAYTEARARGQGIGTALLQHAFDWARAEGYERCSVDFESANIPGSRFWLGTAGFQPVCHSLMRRVDQRLAWANAQRDPVDVLRAYERRTWIG